MGRPPSDIQARLVVAARARFLHHGVDGASLREIARDAQTSLGMVVYYFPNKDDLFLAVVEDVYAGIVQDLDEALRMDTSARERLRMAFVRLGHASDLELEVMRLIAREAMSSSTRLRKLFSRFMRGHLRLLIRTISDGIETGEFDATISPPVILVAALGLGGVPQIARRVSRSVPLFAALPPVEELAELSVRLLMKVVGSPAATHGKRGQRRTGR